MSSPAIPCVLLCLLLVAPHLGSCYHTSYTAGGRHVVLRSSGHDSRAPSTCSSIPSGDGGLPLMHPLSQCSPSAAGFMHQGPGDSFFHRDAVRLHELFGESSYVDPNFGLTIPSTGTPLVALPGANEYHIIVGYGTPVQNLAVGFDTATVGATFLQCNPCAAGAACDKAFDPSRSSSLAKIPCGSRDCPLKTCSGPTCTLTQKKKNTILLNATFVEDKLTMAPSISVNDFRVFVIRTLDYIG